MRRNAFTLIELAMVLALLGILATSAAVSLKAPYQQARFENAVQRVEAIDQRARDHARRFNRPAELVISLMDGSLLVADPHSQKTLQQLAGLGGARVDRVAMSDRRLDYGAAVVTINGRGSSPTYAVRLDGPVGQRLWLVFAGRTGQMTRIENEDELEAILKLTAAEGSDAP